MQRFVLVFCLTALVATTPLFARQMEDVVHLKNGSTVNGSIPMMMIGWPSLGSPLVGGAAVVGN